MGKVFCIVGKSSSGKDTIYKKLLSNATLQLKRIVLYTTRPIRAGEQEGVEYYFTEEKEMQRLQNDNKIIECRSYNTIYGIWYYFMVKDNQIDLAQFNYLIIGTLESYIKIRDYFGQDKVVPIYIDLDDGERLMRALRRERKQYEPKYEEMCRRFLADAKDFSIHNLEQAGIIKRFCNDNLNVCLSNIEAYILSFQEV
ncbi:MAG: guanylate kinase [Lachnospiraceae bacterium]